MSVFRGTPNYCILPMCSAHCTGWRGSSKIRLLFAGSFVWEEPIKLKFFSSQTKNIAKNCLILGVLPTTYVHVQCTPALHSHYVTHHLNYKTVLNFWIVVMLKASNIVSRRKYVLRLINHHFIAYICIQRHLLWYQYRRCHFRIVSNRVQFEFIFWCCMQNTFIMNNSCRFVNLKQSSHRRGICLGVISDIPEKSHEVKIADKRDITNDPKARPYITFLVITLDHCRARHVVHNCARIRFS